MINLACIIAFISLSTLCHAGVDFTRAYDERAYVVQRLYEYINNIDTLSNFDIKTLTHPEDRSPENKRFFDEIQDRVYQKIIIYKLMSSKPRLKERSVKELEVALSNLKDIENRILPGSTIHASSTPWRR